MLYYLLYLLSLIPLRVSYFFVDVIIYPLLYHVIRYRRRIVHKNLVDCFPEKTEKEIQRIERDFYHFMCDCFVETIYTMSMSEEEMRKRVTCTNVELVKEKLMQGHSVAVYLGHYCNWEWMSSYPLWLGEDNPAECLQISHPLENKGANKVFFGIREKFGAKCITMADTLRYLVRASQSGKQTITGFVADQVPTWESIHHWMPFLNHEETPVLTGVEKIAKRLKMDVYYLDCDRIKRGYYSANVVKIAEVPYDMPDYEITEKYIRLVEATIRRKPELWLWSHNRWKRTKEEYAKRFDLETGKKKPLK